MKVKTSIILSKDLLRAIDEKLEADSNRSEFIENAVWAFIAKIIRNEQNANNLEILNRSAEHLNQEAADVLEYQVPL
jgi:metal-responsive CopG/Arc/MetJ family transcriptional regulator